MRIQEKWGGKGRGVNEATALDGRTNAIVRQPAPSAMAAPTHSGFSFVGEVS